MRIAPSFSSAVLALALTTGACSKSAPPAQAPAAAPATDSAPAAVAPGEPAPVSDVAARRKALAALLDEQWQYTMAHSPEFASILGDLRYNDQWSDNSAEGIARDLEATKQFLARFEAIDTTGFPEQEVLNKRLMVRSLREELDSAVYESWLMPIDQMSGVHIRLPQFVSMLRFQTVKDYEDYIKRLETVPVVFDQTIANMRAGMAKKLMPPKNNLQLATTQAERLSKEKAADSPFAQPIKTFPDGIGKADQDRLRAAALAAIKDKVLPAYVGLATFLRKEYAPKGRTEPGLWALPDGAARYALAVKESTTLDLSPEEIHELGLREVARIEGRQAEIAKTLGFKDLASFQVHVRKNKKLYAKSRQDILDRYQRYTDQMYAVLPKLFGRLPKQKMIIKATETFREKEAAGAEYNQGTPDGSRPGMVQVNTYDPTRRLTIDMESTALHEGVPGHHMQIAIQQELGELPPFRQQGNYNSYAEGWALYSESLGEEVGFYTDPYSHYGHLQDEMLRAIRLVVDTGVHHKKWSRKQMVDFFHAHSTIDEPSVQAETDRYIAWPGQALGYKIGQLTILALRQKAKTELGAAFDIRAFHDEVLGAGALPLGILEERIDAWVARQKGTAAAGGASAAPTSK
jgi:uncharacterized protein (DUF885 family)